VNAIASPEILSQAGPSTLSVKIDPDNPEGIIFTGDKLPTNMFPFAIQAYSGDELYNPGDTVANTSFEIIIDYPTSSNFGMYTFDYFLPSD
jgi:hypothetical protein